jgi:hypothetical protein
MMIKTFKGLVEIQNSNGALTVGFDGNKGDIVAGGNGQDGDIVIRDKNGRQPLRIRAAAKDIILGQNVPAEVTITINGAEGLITLGGNGKWGTLNLKDINGKDTFCANAGGNIFLGGNGQDGDLVIKDTAGKTRIHLDGQIGDIKLDGADCAEDFDILNNENVEPGTVMVINDLGKLKECTENYDKKVAGVVSGGGGLKPGIILAKKSDKKDRVPIALSGKVFCKVDASFCPIEIGSLLTTSSTAGHARKVTDYEIAFGSVIGKALKPIERGKSLIPILVTLH